jgi:uncharacterized protein YndB with AHSA1/START domain
MPVTRGANSHTFHVSTPSDTAILMTRVFDAPRHLVFEAMTKPEHIRKWWGILDDGYSVPVCEMDLRPGGKWRFVGAGPKGQSPDFYGEVREVTPPERMVYTEIFAPFPDVVSVVTSVLTEEAGKTRLTVHCEYPTKEVRDMVVTTGMERGAAISYDRLDEVARGLMS